MFCTKCGKSIPENASFCPNCAAPVNVQDRQQPAAPQQTATPRQPVEVTDWLIPSILSTMLCCVPLGVVSIVFAAQANSLAGQGKYEDARKAADKAKLFFFLAVGLWVLAVALYILVYVFMIIIGVSAAAFSN